MHFLQSSTIVILDAMGPVMHQIGVYYCIRDSADILLRISDQLTVAVCLGCASGDICSVLLFILVAKEEKCKFDN